MWHSRLPVATLALVAGVAAAGGEQLHFAPGSHWTRWLMSLRSARAASHPLPQGAGSDLVLSRCVICHSLEVATQQRQGPRGWAEIIDRMISYGAPIQPEERTLMINYFVQHFGDPAGR